jgi:hypothetical protein
MSKVTKKISNKVTNMSINAKKNRKFSKSEDNIQLRQVNTEKTTRNLSLFLPESSSKIMDISFDTRRVTTFKIMTTEVAEEITNTLREDENLLFAGFKIKCDFEYEFGDKMLDSKYRSKYIRSLQKKKLKKQIENRFDWHTRYGLHSYFKELPIKSADSYDDVDFNLRDKLNVYFYVPTTKGFSIPSIEPHYIRFNKIDNTSCFRIKTTYHLAGDLD